MVTPRTDKKVSDTTGGRQKAACASAWVRGTVVTTIVLLAVVTATLPIDCRSDSQSEHVEPDNPPDAADRQSFPPGQSSHEDATYSILPVRLQPSWTDIDDPQQDGWSSEAWTDHADKRLKRLGETIVSPQPVDASELESLVAEGFSCTTLMPNDLATAYRDRVLHVERAQIDAASGQQSAAYFGVSGLAEALQKLRAPFRQTKSVRFKFKLFHVEQKKETILTRQYFSLSGRTATGILEQNARWTMHWTGGLTDNQPPQLNWIACDGFEQVTSQHADGPLFVDCTESVLGKNACYRKQFLYGMNHWLERIQETRYFSALGNPGLAVADVNGDGLDDLYVCQESSLPNRLFLQREDGTAVDVSQQWGVDWLESSRSALLVDLDNDGDQDLVVALLGSVLIASNEQQQGFAIRAVLPTEDDTMSLCAADYDQDRDLDIYVCVYNSTESFSQDRATDLAKHDARDQDPDYSRNRVAAGLGGGGGLVYHDANNASPNSLFRNDISAGSDDSTNGWRFTDTTQQSGLNENNRRFSLAAAWDDSDDDGDQDLYVANDFGRNNLYRNELVPTGEAVFTDVAAQSAAEDSASGMSVAWGDANRDGRMDLYVANMFSAAGNRITRQSQFKSSAADPVRNRLRRFARGNSLFQQGESGRFRDVSLAAGVTVGRWAWGSVFVDINNDAWQDLVVANGYITADETGDL